MSNDKGQLFLKIDGREMGPFTVEEVKDMINEGTFRPFDYIRTGDKKTLDESRKPGASETSVSGT